MNILVYTDPSFTLNHASHIALFNESFKVVKITVNLFQIGTGTTVMPIRSAQHQIRNTADTEAKDTAHTRHNRHSSHSTDM